MSMKANDHSGSGSFKSDPIEPGAYPARIVVIANIGLQKQNPYQGKDKPPKHEFYITYELLDEFLKDEDGEDDLEKPRWVSERFTINPLSVENAKSTERYLALDPKNQYDGDWSELLETPCVVNIVQNPSKKDKTKIYNNVRGVQTMRDKDARSAPKLVNDPVIFDFYDPDVKVFLALPEFLQKLIKESLDFEGSKLEELLEDVSEADEKKDEKKTSKPKEKTKPKPKPDEDDEDEDVTEDDGDDWDE